MAAQHGAAGRGPGELSVPPFSVELDDLRRRVRLRGELDEDTAAVVACVIDGQIARGTVDVCVDLAELVFFDLRGFRALWSANERLRAAGGGLRVVNPSPLFSTVATWWGAPELIERSAVLPTPRSPGASASG
jgi:anti-anti-sigma factor